MISGRGNAPVTTEERTAIYLQNTPMGIALGWIGAVLIVLFVILTALLGCLGYPFIWLSIKSRLLVSSRPAPLAAKPPTDPCQ